MFKFRVFDKRKPLRLKDNEITKQKVFSGMQDEYVWGVGLGWGGEVWNREGGGGRGQEGK
jgi:hypothetical protein